MHACHVCLFLIIDANCGVQNFIQMMPHTQEEAHAASYGNSVSMHEIPQAGSIYILYIFIYNSTCKLSAAAVLIPESGIINL